jgi:anaerobic nitric oxide reductase transcription regulator
LAEQAVAEPTSVPLTPDQVLSTTRTLRVAREDFDRYYLDALLRMHNGNVMAASRAAGVERSNFHRLLVKFGLR